MHFLLIKCFFLQISVDSFLAAAHNAPRFQQVLGPQVENIFDSY